MDDVELKTVDNVLISVIVPIYNIESYLKQCVTSIISQSYNKLEIILVNDGSTDSSGMICDEYGRSDNRIKVIHKTNRGLVAARKTGIEKATGAYILNVDGDDWIEPHMIEKLLGVALTNESDIVQCSFVSEYGDNSSNTIFPNFSTEICGNTKDDILGKMLVGENYVGINIWNKLYKAAAFKSIYESVPDDLSLGEDSYAYLHMLLSDIRFSSVSDILYHYRRREESYVGKLRDTGLMVDTDYLIALMKSVIDERFNVPEKSIRKWVFRKKMLFMTPTLSQYGVTLQKWWFGGIEKITDSNVVLYGAASVGRDYMLQFAYRNEIRVVAWVDKNADKYGYNIGNVCSVDTLLNVDFDYVVIAVVKETTANEIINELVNAYGIRKDRLIWERPLLLWEYVSGEGVR